MNDWDHSAITGVIKLKVSEVRNHINEHRIHTEWKRDVNDMDRALLLLDRLEKDEYGEKYHRQLDKKYGKVVWYTEDDVLNTEKKQYKSSFSKRKKETYKNKEALRKVEKEAWAKENEDREKDWNEFWTLLKDKLRNWWD